MMLDTQGNQSLLQISFPLPTCRQCRSLPVKRNTGNKPVSKTSDLIEDLKTLKGRVMKYRDLFSGRNGDSVDVGFSLPSWASSTGPQRTMKSLKPRITTKGNRTHRSCLDSCLPHSQMPFEIFPPLSQQMLSLFIFIVSNMWYPSLDKMSGFYSWCFSHCSSTSPSFCDSFYSKNKCIFS